MECGIKVRWGCFWFVVSKPIDDLIDFWDVDGSQCRNNSIENGGLEQCWSKLGLFSTLTLESFESWKFHHLFGSLPFLLEPLVTVSTSTIKLGIPMNSWVLDMYLSPDECLTYCRPFKTLVTTTLEVRVEERLFESGHCSHSRLWHRLANISEETGAVSSCCPTFHVVFCCEMPPPVALTFAVWRWHLKLKM